MARICLTDTDRMEVREIAKRWNVSLKKVVLV